MIARAKKQEPHSLDLQNHIESILPHLHHTITLPEDQPTSSLTVFIIRYIENVPDFMDVLCNMMHEAGVYKHGENLISIIAEFFLCPPHATLEHSGLHALIDEAYLAHRLLEEMNDRLIMLCGTPLTPMDMTLSNIIIHEVLGDEFANELDLAVHYAIESLFDTPNPNTPIAEFIRQFSQAQKPCNQWPCLAEDSAIALKFGTETLA